jgi:hypothetical protein
VPDASPFLSLVNLIIMKDKWEQEVQVGDYVMCSPIWSTTTRNMIVARVKRTANKRVQVDVKSTYWPDAKPMWIENFVKLPEDWAKQFYDVSLTTVNKRWEKYPQIERC